MNELRNAKSTYIEDYGLVTYEELYNSKEVQQVLKKINTKFSENKTLSTSVRIRLNQFTGA